MSQVHDNHWPQRGVKTRRIVGDLPPLEFRVFTREAPKAVSDEPGVTLAEGLPIRFLARLIRAAVAIKLGIGASRSSGPKPPPGDSKRVRH
jgi:hypothetical protein